MPPETVTIYDCKYVCASGAIDEVFAKPSAGGDGSYAETGMQTGLGRFFYHGHEGKTWSLDPIQARAIARKLIARKIASVKKQLAKLQKIQAQF